MTLILLFLKNITTTEKKINIRNCQNLNFEELIHARNVERFFQNYKIIENIKIKLFKYANYKKSNHDKI